MAVRLRMDKGPDLVILAGLDEVNRAFQAALPAAPGGPSALALHVPHCLICFPC